MNEGLNTAMAPIDLAIVLGFLVVVTIVGYATSKLASQGLDDYFLGGRKIPWWVLGASTASSNFDMAGTMIIVAVVFGLGYKGFLVEIRGGVGLSLAFLMVFLGKWLRRSRVMTSAEWMKLRFGTDRQGKAAHLLSAVANILLSLGMIVYFAKGAGKFLTFFLPFSEVTCTSAMVGVGLFYTLMSGLYGVVFTDVIQMVLLAFTAIFVTVEAFTITPQITIPEGFLSLDLEVARDLTGSLVHRDPAAWEPILQAFGLCVFLWVARTFLEGMSGIGGYTDQRFFAARSEREASLLTLESIVLSVLRWMMVAGLVVMGLHILQSDLPGADRIQNDAEQVLPVVLAGLLPAGVKGFVVSGLIAAAMSTFDSTLNAGAAYVVKDIYQSYLNPEADDKQLMRASRGATVALCVLGVGLAALVPNINQIWGLITMGLGAGMFVPLFLRWYWPRLNGYGFAAGTAAGLVAALVFDAGLGWYLYHAFPTIVGCAFVAAVGTSLATQPTANATLDRFFIQINPWGLWGAVAKRVEERGEVDKQEAAKRMSERISDAIALVFAVPFQFSILVAAMALVFHDWGKLTGFASAALLCSIGLYFFWYRGLKSEEECERDDARFDPKT